MCAAAVLRGSNSDCYLCFELGIERNYSLSLFVMLQLQNFTVYSNCSQCAAITAPIITASVPSMCQMLILGFARGRRVGTGWIATLNFVTDMSLKCLN